MGRSAPCTDTLELPGRISIPRQNQKPSPSRGCICSPSEGTRGREILGWRSSDPGARGGEDNDGDSPSAWHHRWHEHRERAGRGRTPPSAPVPRSLPGPAPAAAAADSSRPCQEMSFSSGEVFAQWLPPRPHPARHTRARARRLRLLFAPMATCEGPHASFLPLLFLGSPSAGNAGLGAAGVAGGGGQAVTLVGLSGYCPALRPGSGNPGGFN